MRKTTRGHIYAELSAYWRSRREYDRVKEQLSELTLFPSYSKDMTTEQILYLQDRLRYLKQVTQAIGDTIADCSSEERNLLQMKFWDAKPRKTDEVIAKTLGISRVTMYRMLNGICKRISMRIGYDI